MGPTAAWPGPVTTAWTIFLRRGVLHVIASPGAPPERALLGCASETH
jgi:hypothetical protein